MDSGGSSSDEKSEVKGKLTMRERYRAAMILSAIGDAMGYKNGEWEFCKFGKRIHSELENFGGVMKIDINPKDWMVSDDTVMHLATAEALCGNWDDKSNKDLDEEKKIQQLYKDICELYVICWEDMSGRAPGIQCRQAMPYLEKGDWDKVPFSRGGGGCGAAMRTMCIGMYFWRPQQLDKLIAISIESSRMTHTHPTGFFGGVVAALFTSYAIQNIPIAKWGYLLMNGVLEKCVKYLEESKRDYELYTEGDTLTYFKDAWTKYLNLRGISEYKEGITPVFPSNYDVTARDKFYSSISFSGWGGSSGHDSVIIAYDALLGCEGSWEEFCLRGILHGGDNDSTGAIGGAWFGAIYGFEGVPLNHYQNLEKKTQLEQLASELYSKSHRVKKVKKQSDNNNNNNNNSQTSGTDDGTLNSISRSNSSLSYSSTGSSGSNTPGGPSI